MLADFYKSHGHWRHLKLFRFFLLLSLLWFHVTLHFYFLECTPRSTDSSVGSSEGSINQVRFQDPLCTIHSYEIEHSDSDSVGPHETHDSDDEEMYMDSKWSTWCWSKNVIGFVTWAYIISLLLRDVKCKRQTVYRINLLFGKFSNLYLVSFHQPCVNPKYFFAIIFASCWRKFSPAAKKQQFQLTTG